MEAKQLLDLVQRYEDNREFIVNEESTKMALVVPFIRHLGYDPQNPREIRHEFRAEFTHGDGKRHPDRMDYAIFDRTGSKPLMVIEAKPLGWDIITRSKQLARYIGQLADLHFGIITDGCNYLFFGDLEKPNVMDAEPFFSFSLADQNADWTRVGKFLAKFSRDAFNAETLVTDAEDSRYRQAMIKKIAATLRQPKSDEMFLKWLTTGIYQGKKTTSVMDRLGQLAKEAIEPALVSVLEDDFLDTLRQRFQRVRETAGDSENDKTESALHGVTETQVAPESTSVIETTDEELEFHQAVVDICTTAGVPADDVLFKDTINYFNVSYRKQNSWFVRFFGTAKRKSVVSRVPLEEATQLAASFQVDRPPANFGDSRVYIDSVDQVRALRDLVLRSLEISRQ